MSDKPFHNPFGALAGLRETMRKPDLDPKPDAGTAAPQAPDPPSAAGRRGPARAVVRMERSGRGGKIVTVIDHLDLAADEWTGWLKALKASLGCGGALEGGSIVLQGDQRQRLPALLSARGVRKVTVA